MSSRRSSPRAVVEDVALTIAEAADPQPKMAAGLVGAMP